MRAESQVASPAGRTGRGLDESRAESPIESLLLAWEAGGRVEAPEAVAAGAPDLLDELRSRIADLLRADAAMAGGAAAADSAVAPEVDGYRVVGRLGEGGMGVVWRAVQLSTRRDVALKVMSAAGLGSVRAQVRFQREVELAARLEHPHIARVYDGGQSRGLSYYAMELVDGLPLDRYVQRH